jgi:ZIP family zinc transporter
MIILIAIATVIATFAGGLLALRFKDKLHLIMGFSAGAVIALAFFDLIPESIEIGSKYFDIGTITSITAIGFIAYLILDRLIFLHGHHGGHDHEHEMEKINGSDNDSVFGMNSDQSEQKRDVRRGILGASSLSVHSFFDGLAIGLAFQVSTAIGVVVAIAVLVHDFSDGINTVNMILKNKGKGRSAFKWLIVDSIAPVLGVVSTLFFSLSEKSLSVVLALFAGFFLYIGASDLVPESHHAHPKFLTTAMTIVGAGVLFLAIKLAQI